MPLNKFEQHLTISEFEQYLLDFVKNSQQKRLFIALAGAPASGKSTLSTQLNALLNAEGIASAIVPMDGFHLANEVLRQRGLLSRKGSPQTFDVEGLINILTQLKNNQRSTITAIPIFDRVQDKVIENAKTITPEVKVIIVEGNYLLLNAAPWQQLAELFDLTVMLKHSEKTIETRLKQRWQFYQLNKAAIKQKITENDLPNARLVYQNSQTADIIINN